MFRILTAFFILTASLFLTAENETCQVRLKAGRERSYHQEEYEDSGFITTTTHNEGYNNIAVIEPIMVHDDVRVIGRLMTEVKKGRLAPWVVDLCAMYEVDLREVLETHEQWYHHTTQMSMPLRTFLAVALTIYTGGEIATFFSDHLTGVYPAVAKSVGAAMEGITNTFIVSTIANGGDLGKVFKELTDSRYLKGLVASALAAGLVSKFIDKPIADKAKLAKDEKVLGAIAEAEKAGKSVVGVELAAESAAIKGLDFTTRLGRNLRAAALTTGVSSAVSGGKVGKNVLSGLGGAVVDTGAAHIAHQIGKRYANGSGDMSWLTHKVCHFVLGGTAAEFTGGDFLAGGSGAAIGEMVCEHVQHDLLEQTFRQAEELSLNDNERMDLFLQNIEESERYGRLAAAGTALIGRMDITVSDSSAHTAIDENSIPHFIVGGAVLTYVAYDYFQTLASEGWEGLFQQIKEEVGESISMGGGNPVIITGTFVTKKLERITTKLLSTRFGSFLEKHLIKPGTKAFDDFVEFLVSKTSGLQPAFAGEGKIVSKELKVSISRFESKLAQHESKGRTIQRGRFTTVVTEVNGTVREGMNVEAVGKYLKTLTKGKNPVLKKVKSEPGVYQVMQDVGCLKKNQYIRLDDAYVKDATFCTHAHIEVLKSADQHNRKLLYNCVLDENGIFKVKE